MPSDQRGLSSTGDRKPGTGEVDRTRHHHDLVEIRRHRPVHRPGHQRLPVDRRQLLGPVTSRRAEALPRSRRQHHAQHRHPTDATDTIRATLVG